MKRKPIRKRAVDDQKVPSQPRDIPVNCPLFPTVRCASVGKIVLQAIEYDDTGDEHRQTIVHPRVTPEMDEADIAAIAGGGEYYVGIHKNDGTGQLINHRKVEIFGPPKEFEDDDDWEGNASGGKGKPTVIPVPGGEPIIIPSGIKGSDQAAYIAQQQQIRGLQKQAESGGGGVAAVVGSMMQLQMKSSETTAQLMIAMMNGGGQNSAAMMALQGQLNAANTEKAALIAQHGAALNALREEHSATMAALRAELAKALDEGRRLTGLMELKTEEARSNARKSAEEDNHKLRDQINRLEQSLLGSERNALRIQAEARGASEAIEFAKLAIPTVEKAINKLGSTSGLPAELQATVDAIQKEILPTVRRLNAHPLLASGGDEPDPRPVAETQPAPADSEPVPERMNGAPLVPVPDMPG